MTLWAARCIWAVLWVLALWASAKVNDWWPCLVIVLAQLAVSLANKELAGVRETSDDDA
ncbi:MAG: hypothetical protein ACR2QF_07235 [Geminicoccaceae bacterium]